MARRNGALLPVLIVCLGSFLTTVADAQWVRNGVRVFSGDVNTGLCGLVSDSRRETVHGAPIGIRRSDRQARPRDRDPHCTNRARRGERGAEVGAHPLAAGQAPRPASGLLEEASLRPLKIDCRSPRPPASLGLSLGGALPVPKATVRFSFSPSEGTVMRSLRLFLISRRRSCLWAAAATIPPAACPGCPPRPGSHWRNPWSRARHVCASPATSPPKSTARR